MDLRLCIGRTARIIGGLAAGLARETRGNVAMLFALSMPVLVLMTLGGVDIHRASTVRLNLQDALDAASLAAARSQYTDAENIQRIGMTTLKANLQAYPDISLVEDETTFVLNDDRVVVSDAKVNVKTLVANLFLPPYGSFAQDYLPVGAHSEVNRSSKNLEVGLVLDVTGSMDGQKLEDLKAAARELVEIVVQPVQTPFYSKMAIIPYSAGVTLTSSAVTSARGAPTGPRNISGAAWSTGSQKSIGGISRANPGVVSSNNHGFVTGDWVWISGVSGMTQVNNRAYRVVRLSSNSYSLQAANGGSWSAVSTRDYNSYSSGGIARECLVSDCSVVITANGHGLDDGDFVYISDVVGMTQINNKGYRVGNATTNTFSIGANGAGWGAYSRGGRSFCGQNGCQWRVYLNPSNTMKWVETGACVSERTGAQAYTDASPSSARVSFNYAYSSNDCPDQTVQPLTASKSTLRSLIDSLETSGSTAGQIGAAWGWYAVSPSFNGLWPSNGAGPYNSNDQMKAVVIMTDGEFNTNYCEGVLARDASYGGNNRINCNAENGDPYAQTERLCTAMKARDVIVYTVGFQMNARGRGAQVLNACATSGSAFLPSSGADLSDAFKAIGRDITRLRISR